MALRHPQSHWGLRLATRASWGCCFKELDDGAVEKWVEPPGDREAGTVVNLVSSPLSPGRPWLYQVKRISKGPLPHSHLQGSGGGLQTLSALCGRYLNWAGDMVGCRTGSPQHLQTHSRP